MVLALIFFALSAIGGIVFAAKHLQNDPPPIPVGLVHGVLGAAGLSSLALAVFNDPTTPPAAKTALMILVVAALGGFVLFGFRLAKKAIPKPVLFVHALVAVSGVLVLVKAVLG